MKKNHKHTNAREDLFVDEKIREIRLMRSSFRSEPHHPERSKNTSEHMFRADEPLRCTQVPDRHHRNDQRAIDRARIVSAKFTDQDHRR
jgi:hypothetical protein